MYKVDASCTLTFPSGTIETSNFSVLFAYSISIISPTFNCLAGFAGFPLTSTRPISETVLATVLLFISLDTFKNYVWTSGAFCQFNAKITEDKSFYNSCGDDQGSFTVNYNVDYETKLDISIDKNDKAKDFKITSINKGYTVNYNYYNITKNEQVKLYLLMLDENLQKRHIGTIFLICNSDS